MKQAIISTCDDVLGRPTIKRKPWISDNTWQMAVERKNPNKPLTKQRPANRSRPRQSYTPSKQMKSRNSFGQTNATTSIPSQKKQKKLLEKGTLRHFMPPPGSSMGDTQT